MNAASPGGGAGAGASPKPAQPPPSPSAPPTVPRVGARRARSHREPVAAELAARREATS